MASFENQVEEQKEEMIEILETISIDDLKSEGLSISVGGKTFRFSDMEVIDSESVEDKIRREFREKLNSQQQRIREKINTKINQLLTMHQQKQNELDRKEQQLQRKYNNAAMMPEITYNHAIKGLSVVKNEGHHDELLWLFRGIYQVKYVKRSTNKKASKVKADLLRRLRKDVIVRIKTKGNQIIKVNTCNPDASLSSFSHYHQMTGGNCWGNWKHPKTYSSPDDIIRCAKDALAVLETINEGSVATQNPDGLPSMTTVKKHLHRVNRRSSRLNKDFLNALKSNDAVQVEDDADVWTT